MSSKPLEVWIDFRSPAAYLALGPTLELAQEFDVTLIWRPLRARIERVPEETPAEAKGETHRRVRAQARRATHLLYAELRGIPMVFPERPGQADAALAALAALPEAKRSDFVTACFEAYWQSGADLDDEATLADLGVPAADANLLTHELDAAATSGVIDVPAYVIEEQLFIGREHLPWIRAILAA